MYQDRFGLQANNYLKHTAFLDCKLTFDNLVIEVYVKDKQRFS